jgi:hypothetical protein
MRIITFIIAAAAGSAAVAGQTPPPPPQAPITVTGQRAAPDPNKLVCKYSETGTLIRRKVCMPASEWSRLQGGTSERMKDMRDWQRVRCGMGSVC